MYKIILSSLSLLFILSCSETDTVEIFSKNKNFDNISSAKITESFFKFSELGQNIWKLKNKSFQKIGDEIHFTSDKNTFVLINLKNFNRKFNEISIKMYIEKGDFAKIYWKTEKMSSFTEKKTLKMNLERKKFELLRKYKIFSFHPDFISNKITELKIKFSNQKSNVILDYLSLSKSNLFEKNGIWKEIDPRFFAFNSQEINTIENFTISGRTMLKLNFAFLDSSKKTVAPFLFKLFFNTDSEQHELFTFNLKNIPNRKNQWIPLNLDLSKFSGKTGTLGISFGASGNSNLVFTQPKIISGRKTNYPFENFIIILVDTLRADHLNLYGYNRITMPKLTKVTNENGILFKNAMAQSPCTFPSVASLMTSQPPFKIFSHGFGVLNLPKNYLSIQKFFRKKGFSTAAFTASPIIHNDSTIGGYAEGFETFDQRCEWKGGNCINKNSFKWIDSHSNDNFSLYLHYMDVHDPYFPPEEFQIFVNKNYSGPSFIQKGNPNPIYNWLYKKKPKPHFNDDVY